VAQHEFRFWRWPRLKEVQGEFNFPSQTMKVLGFPQKPSALFWPVCPTGRSSGFTRAVSQEDAVCYMGSRALRALSPDTMLSTQILPSLGLDNKKKKKGGKISPPRFEENTSLSKCYPQPLACLKLGSDPGRCSPDLSSHPEMKHMTPQIFFNVSVSSFSSSTKIMWHQTVLCFCFMERK